MMPALTPPGQNAPRRYPRTSAADQPLERRLRAVGRTGRYAPPDRPNTPLHHKERQPPRRTTAPDVPLASPRESCGGATSAMPNTAIDSAPRWTGGRACRRPPAERHGEHQRHEQQANRRLKKRHTAKPLARRSHASSATETACRPKTVRHAVVQEDCSSPSPPRRDGREQPACLERGRAPGKQHQPPP